MFDFLFSIFGFCVGMLLMAVILQQPITGSDYDQCNLNKPSGATCVLQRGYEWEISE